MKLTRLFAVSITLLAVLIGAMLGRILWDEWWQYRAVRDGVHTLQLVQRAMRAAEKLSVERGPVNGVLGDAVPPDPAKAARLRGARAATDLALAELRAALIADPVPQTEALAAQARLQTLLAAARGAVDRLAAAPPAARTPARLTDVVEQMFALIPVEMATVDAFSRSSERVYPQLAQVLIKARYAVDLREYAGRIGSRLTPALSTGQPLAQEASRRIEELRGRIEELRQLLEADADADRRVTAATDAMNRDYFGAGLAQVAQVEQASRDGRPYGMDTAQFAQRYVPHMAPIVTVRDALLQAALEQAQRTYAAAGSRLLLACLTGAMLLLALTLLLLIVHRRVLRPLLWATRALVNLGNGDLITEVRVPERRDEIGVLLRALARLRESSIARQQLELERGRLIDELKHSANTDYLTGILNRRAFTVAGNQRVRRAREDNLSLAVILFDIDHFKSVNDIHGHDAGDQALIRIAARIKEELRNGEVLARYGGEEFIVMPAHCDLAAARAVAERIRSAIAAEPLPLADGHILRVTASFGVAAASGPQAALDGLLHAADLALYRAKANGRDRVED